MFFGFFVGFFATAVYVWRCNTSHTDIYTGDTDVARATMPDVGKI